MPGPAQRQREPLRPSPECVADIAAAVAEAAGTLNRYPDREFAELRTALAAYLSQDTPHGVVPEQVWAANGSNEVMLQLLQAFGGPGRTALSFAPTYSMYPEYARDTNTEWVVGHREEDFSLDLDHAGALVERAPAGRRAAAVAQQPDRHRAPARRGRALCEAARGRAGGASTRRTASSAAPACPSALELLPEHRNLVVTRTMSKAFALAGARLGYLAADPAICDAIRVVRLPYHLSAVTQAVALAALRHAPELLGRVDELRAERDATVDLAARAGSRGRRQRRQFRVVRRLRGSSCCLAGAARPRVSSMRETGPDGWLRVSIGTAGRDEVVHDWPEPGDGGAVMSRTARIERQTSESKVLVEVDLDGSGRHDGGSLLRTLRPEASA